MLGIAVQTFLSGATGIAVFGVAVGDRRQGWALLAAMAVIFVVMAGLTIHVEQQGDVALAPSAIAHLPTAFAGPVGNMEGKETRFGVVSSALYAAVTTSGGDGSVDAMHDSFTPLGGLAPMVLMSYLPALALGPIVEQITMMAPH
ncbi:potassium-transporting ATPase A subunit [Trinickia symbiotica]|uniref:potassium-transporting ATPase subunit KdpA n=1 Tax=Trinickia symbiotica TaxID=863227 RepID=UPI0003A66E29|nr:potassium-transporting ATPase subunit KdpA [Trinickia symbiotica]PPK42031.1 potassium-transporting ATPase A subunit [Trinickia symbiotica]